MRRRLVAVGIAAPMAILLAGGAWLGWAGDAGSAPPSVASGALQGHDHGPSAHDHGPSDPDTGSEPSDLGRPPIPDRTHLACTLANELTNFAAYSVGSAFEGMAITHTNRVCTRPDPQAIVPHARINIVEYIYGHCPALGEVSRCRPPIAVQTWPRCERNPASYTVDHHNPLVRKLSVRGVPAQLYEDGLRLEVYAGESTIVVFGVDPAQVLRAGRALVKAPARPTDPVGGGDLSIDLPHPPTGSIRCE